MTAGAEVSRNERDPRGRLVWRSQGKYIQVSIIRESGTVWGIVNGRPADSDKRDAVCF